MGDTRAIVRLAPLVKDIFAQDGFHVKVTKSTITGSDIETIASIDPLPVVSVTDGNAKHGGPLCG